MQRKHISTDMATKIAGSGLSYRHLKAAFARDPVNGIGRVLAEAGPGGKVRVTKTKKISESLNRHFQAEKQTV